jgi:hypothetical protein
MVIPADQPEPAGTYLVTWNGHGDALALYRLKPDGSLEIANSFTYGSWGQPASKIDHPNSANANLSACQGGQMPVPNGHRRGPMSPVCDGCVERPS